MNGAFARWRANFYAGLAIILPAVVSIAIVKWLFGTVSNITDPLLFFVPNTWTHPASGPMYWWWSLLALCLAVVLISLIGRMARNYFGKKLIASVDRALLRVPVMNRIYSAIKQVNDAFTAPNKHSFKQVVLVEYPSSGLYALGFLTGAQPAEVRSKLQEKLASVFIPTTPNPTGGFVFLVPEDRIVYLEMSVAEGLKFVLSLGSVTPEYLPSALPQLPALPPPAVAPPAQAEVPLGG